MTFWMGVIVGTGFGAFFCTIIFMFLMRSALRMKSSSENEFQEIQRMNGMHICRIADAIETVNFRDGG